MGDTIYSIALVIGIASIVISGVAISVSIGLSDWFDTMMRNIHNGIEKVGKWKS